MSKKILLGCYGVPGRGGASTALYLLFERMQADGLDVSYINLVEEADAVFLRYQFGDTFENPRALANVHTCILEEPPWRPHAALTELIGALAPDLLLGFGFIPARLMKQAAPRRPVVFMPAGTRHVQHLIETGAVRDFMACRRGIARGITFPVPLENPERQAVESSDLIIVHSPLIRFAFEQLFPTHMGRMYANVISVADLIYPEAEPFAALKQPFAQRDIDLIFIASSWNRRIKNYRLVHKIISRCQELNVHVVGDIEQPHPPAQYHGTITRREELYTLLGRSKTLACPSLLDAAPGVLFEASAMDCNVVASPNCGNWQLCNAQLLAESCSPDAFQHKIALSIAGVYKDNREHFRGGYADLVDTLSVF
jgi:glycosyltransferase involved in cell wall biosynthesis